MCSLSKMMVFIRIIKWKHWRRLCFSFFSEHVQRSLNVEIFKWLIKCVPTHIFKRVVLSAFTFPAARGVRAQTHRGEAWCPAGSQFPFHQKHPRLNLSILQGSITLLMLVQLFNARGISNALHCLNMKALKEQTDIYAYAPCYRRSPVQVAACWLWQSYTGGPSPKGGVPSSFDATCYQNHVAVQLPPLQSVPHTITSFCLCAHVEGSPH